MYRNIFLVHLDQWHCHLIKSFFFKWRHEYYTIHVYALICSLLKNFKLGMVSKMGLFVLIISFRKVNHIHEQSTIKMENKSRTKIPSIILSTDIENIYTIIICKHIKLEDWITHLEDIFFKGHIINGTATFTKKV